MPRFHILVDIVWCALYTRYFTNISIIISLFLCRNLIVGTTWSELFISSFVLLAVSVLHLGIDVLCLVTDLIISSLSYGTFFLQSQKTFWVISELIVFFQLASNLILNRTICKCSIIEIESNREKKVLAQYMLIYISKRKCWK